jgi:hypothetical protein
MLDVNTHIKVKKLPVLRFLRPKCKLHHGTHCTPTAVPFDHQSHTRNTHHHVTVLTILDDLWY